MSFISQGDALETRDAWRFVWRALASRATLASVLVLVGVGAVAWFLLPQAPPDAQADPVAYSRWEALARQREGALFEAANALGLNAVAQAVWWRLALAIGIALSALRLLGRLADASLARFSDEPRLDEERLQVIHDAPSALALIRALGARGLSIQLKDDATLVALSPPWSVVASALLHAGLIALLMGLAVQTVGGWSLQERSLSPADPLELPDRRTLALDEAGRIVLGDRASAPLPQPGSAIALDGVSVHVRQRLSGYRLSAERDGERLGLLSSSFSPPRPELVVFFTEAESEHFIAAPQGALAVALRATQPSAPPLLEAFALPSGEVLAQTAVQPEVQVGAVRLRFDPTTGAVVDVSHNPGLPLAALGGVLAALGWVGSAALPSRRFVVRWREPWLECYARGRGARQLWLSAVREASTERQGDSAAG